MPEILNDYFAFVFAVEDTYEIHERTLTQLNWIISSDCDYTEDAVTKALDEN